MISIPIPRSTPPSSSPNSCRSPEAPRKVWSRGNTQTVLEEGHCDRFIVAGVGDVHLTLLQEDLLLQQTLRDPSQTRPATTDSSIRVWSCWKMEQDDVRRSSFGNEEVVKEPMGPDVGCCCCCLPTRPSLPGRQLVSPPEILGSHPRGRGSAQGLLEGRLGCHRRDRPKDSKILRKCCRVGSLAKETPSSSETQNIPPLTPFR